MKKIIALAALAALGFGAAQAKHVTSQTAMDIAARYMATVPAGNQATVAGCEALNGNLYLISLEPKGYVIVSADDNAEPIIGYSLESSLSASSIPENMSYILSEASMAVEYNATNGTTSPVWKQVMQGSAASVRSRAAEPVEPLIKVNWNQGTPYNKYCPGEGKNKAVVGCVAVAMSQAMSVQRYPAKPQGNVVFACTGYGNISLDFDKEPAYDWNAILSGANSYDNVARLLYHAGVSVNMGYGADGSGIPANQVYRITNALKNNFGYPSTAYYWRDNFGGDWNQMILNELSNGRAVIYNAVDRKGGYGHSFNVDGYDGSLFHLNWGWGGVGNGYFRLDALRDAQMGMNYDSNHVVVIGIGAGDNPLQQISLSDTVIENDTPDGSAVFAVFVNGELPTADMKVEVTGEYDKNTDSFRQIPFAYSKTDRGVVTLNGNPSEGTYPVRVAVSTTFEGKKYNLVQIFNVSVVPAMPIEKRTSLSYDRQAQTFTLQSKFGTEYTVRNAEGAIVVQGKFEANPTATFTRSQLKPGANTVEVKCNGKSKTFTINL